MSKDWCSAAGQTIRLAVQISPNAKKSEIVGVLDATLKIRVQAPAIEGKANDALVRFLADRLGIPRNAVSIAHGHTGKKKVIEIVSERLLAADVMRILVQFK